MYAMRRHPPGTIRKLSEKFLAKFSRRHLVKSRAVEPGALEKRTVGSLIKSLYVGQCERECFLELFNANKGGHDLKGKL
jgi:hypothetical protein